MSLKISASRRKSVYADHADVLQRGKLTPDRCATQLRKGRGNQKSKGDLVNLKKLAVHLGAEYRKRAASYVLPHERIAQLKEGVAARLQPDFGEYERWKSFFACFTERRWRFFRETGAFH